MFPTSSKSLLPIVASFFLLGATHADADVAQAIPEMGDLERWAAFSLGDGHRFSWAFGHSFIDGDLGLAGNGNFLISEYATVNGDIYDRSNGRVMTFQHAFIYGLIFSNMVTLLVNCVIK